MRTAKILIRMGGCPGLSESALGAQVFCWFCHVVAHMMPIYEGSSKSAGKLEDETPGKPATHLDIDSFQTKR